MKKLTLTLTERDIRTVKRLAKEKGMTVSGLVSGMLRPVSARAKPTKRPAVSESHSTDWRGKLPPIVRQALGMAKFETTKTDRELIGDARAEKYGIK